MRKTQRLTGRHACAPCRRYAGQASESDSGPREGRVEFSRAHPGREGSGPSYLGDRAIPARAGTNHGRHRGTDSGAAGQDDVSLLRGRRAPGAALRPACPACHDRGNRSRMSAWRRRHSNCSTWALRCRFLPMPSLRGTRSTGNSRCDGWSGPAQSSRPRRPCSLNGPKPRIGRSSKRSASLSRICRVRFRGPYILADCWGFTRDLVHYGGPYRLNDFFKLTRFLVRNGRTVHSGWETKHAYHSKACCARAFEGLETRASRAGTERGSTAGARGDESTAAGTP